MTLAVSIGAALLAGMPSAVASTSPPAQLSGHGHGTWQLKPNNLPDTGTQKLVHGHGHFTVGAAKIRGRVTEPGFVAEGSCGISLRLTTATGSIKVVGHSKRASRSDLTCFGQPVRFHFHTTKASGDLAGASYKGVGHVDVENASSDATDHGSFTLKLKPRP